MSIIHLLTYTVCFGFYILFYIQRKDFKDWTVSSYMTFGTTLIWGSAVFIIFFVTLVQKSKVHKVLQLINKIEEYFSNIDVDMEKITRSASKYMIALSLWVIIFHTTVCASLLINSEIKNVVTIVKLIVTRMPYLYIQIVVMKFLSYCIFCKIRYDQLNNYLVRQF